MLRLAIVLLLTALVIAVGSCGGGEPKAPEPTEEERRAEAARLAAEQARQRAEQLAKEKEAALQPPPPPYPYLDESDRVPYEKAFPDAFKGVLPIRIAVLGSPNRPAAGRRVAVMLGGFQRAKMEKKLGRPIRIAFVSRSSKPHEPITRIRYRPGFLQAAIQVARAIPFAQAVEPMAPPQLERESIDVFVYVGENVR